MPIISITQDMLDRGRQPEKGWSPAKFTNATEKKAAKTDSTNYFFEFELTGGPENKDKNTGTYATFYVNSAGLSIGAGMEDFKRMIAALMEIKPSEFVADNYDVDKLKGKQCWIKIDLVANTNGDGKMRPSISDFSRYGDVPF